MNGIDFDQLFAEFDEYCANQSDCRKCFNTLVDEDGACFREYLKKRQKEEANG